MKIINLNQTVYRNYANIHNRRNFGQTIEYSLLNFNIDKKKLFLGLVDDFNNIHAAALILIHSVAPGILEAIAPNGFLIDYSDPALMKTFTEELTKYLSKEKVTFLVTNPMFKYKVYNKNNVIIKNNEAILNNLYNLNYKSLGYSSDFERYDIIIENNDSINNLYHNFNRNTKRNINEGIKLGVTLRKGKISDLEEAYNIIKKKYPQKLSYYQNLMNIYNNNDNKMEFFLAKLNPHKYLVNVQRLYEKERIKNEKIHQEVTKNIGNISEKLLNKKINSDNTIEKLKQSLNRAILLNQNHHDDITIGASFIIKNNHEIYFLIDGYNDNFKDIHSTHILKWAIIKKYYNLGYHIFNLGEINKDYYDKSNKYHTQYLYKIGFGGNVVEYTPKLLLVVNKPMYKLYTKIKKN